MPEYFGYLVVVEIVLDAFVVVADESFLAVPQLAVHHLVVYTFPCVEAFDEPD